MSELVREALRRYQKERAWERLRSFGAMSAEMADLRNEDDVLNLVRLVRQEMTVDKANRAEMAGEIHR